MTTEQKHTLTCGVNQSFNGYCDCGAESKPAPAPLPSNPQVRPTEGPYIVRPAIVDGKRVLHIVTQRYGFILAQLEPDDPEMRATAEIMACSWAKYQDEQRTAPETGAESDWRAEISAMLDTVGPRAVRVREGGGPENVLQSLAVTLVKLCHSAEKTNDGLPPFYTERKCSQCGATEERIQREGCPEKCGRTAGDVNEPRMPGVCNRCGVSLADPDHARFCAGLSSPRPGDA